MKNPNVISLPASTNYTAEQAIASASEMPLADVLIVGYDVDDALYVRSSRMTRAEALFLLEKAKEWVLDKEQR